MDGISKSLAVYDRISKLKDLKRSGWVQRNIECDRIESVAEHCFAMSNLAILISHEKSLDLDMAKVLSMIAIHEYGEVIIGDITPRDNVSKEEKYNKEKQGVIEIIGVHPAKEYVIDLWQEFENQSSNEAIFVFLIDKFQSVLQAKEYSKNYNTPKVAEEFINYYNNILNSRNDIPKQFIK